ncbi:MAG: hypothetical protein MK179_22025, partial [Pirellulaceae bacterium]|nr:hypothetical protein [Pirellulaceae bacterium]
MHVIAGRIPNDVKPANHSLQTRRPQVLRRTLGRSSHGREKQKSTRQTKRRDAEKFTLQLEKELDDGTYRDGAEPTWAEFCERYEVEVLPGLALNTRRRVLTVFGHVEKILGVQFLRQLNEQAL